MTPEALQQTPSHPAPGSALAEAAAREALADRLGEFFLAGGTVGEMLELQPDHYEAFYGMAHGEFSAGRYQDALPLFGLLVQFDPYDFRFPYALACTLEKLGRLEEAIVYYGAACLLDITDPRPLLGMAQCQILREQWEEAADLLARAVELSSVGDPMHERACVLHELILRRTSQPTFRGEKSHG